jgi:hypothetical protein
VTNETGSETHQQTSLEIALQWAQLPAEHLEVSLKALEPQLKREHAYRMEQEARKQALEVERLRLESEQKQLEAQLDFDENQAKRTHALYMCGLGAGFLVCVGMLVGAVVVGINNQPWLAAMLSGPSVVALVTLFVLRKSDASLNSSVEQNQRRALNASQQPPPSPSAPSGPVV